MFMLNSYKGKFIWLMAISLVVVAFIFNAIMYKFFINEKGPKVSCTSFFTVQSDLKTEGVLTLNIDGGGHGLINISASVRDNTDAIKYNILRGVSFEYHYEDNGYLVMRNVTVSKKFSDNTPDELFNGSIFDFSVEKRSLRITELGQGYLLWNEFSPVLMCAPTL